MPQSGVFFSWIIPMIVVMFPVNLLIFGRLLPRHVRTSTHKVELTAAEIGRFFAADYLGALFLYGTIFLVPVLVAIHVAPHTYAYFFLAWAIATMMNLVAVNMAVSMAVEGVHDPSSLAGYCRSALTRALGLLLSGLSGSASRLHTPWGCSVPDTSTPCRCSSCWPSPACPARWWTSTSARYGRGPSAVRIIWSAIPSGSCRIGTGGRLQHYHQLFLKLR